MDRHGRGKEEEKKARGRKACRKKGGRKEGWTNGNVGGDTRVGRT